MGDRRRLVPAALLTLFLTACSAAPAVDDDTDPQQVDAVETPEVGACRVLTPDHVTQASNATRTVPCAEELTAQTYAVGSLPAAFADAEHDDERLGAFAYRTCSQKFMAFLGADESVVMRTVLSWAWFRPSEKAWADGARWYRCDLVGGGEQSRSYLALPEDGAGMLAGLPPDQWMACVAAPALPGSPRVPCSEPHQWRAVTTIVVGDEKDPYPGDRLVEVTTRDYCSNSVAAWLNYPVTYDFAYTWFHEAEWEAGNRRSVCWAKTSQ